MAWRFNEPSDEYVAPEYQQVPLLTVLQDTLPLMMAGWKLWPAVSLLNFTIVPVNRRILVGSIVGLFWGIFLSLFATE